MMLSAEITVIERALELFHNDKDGCYISSVFFDLGINYRISNNASSRIFNGVTQDIWNIATLVARLEWMRSLAIEGTLAEGTWRSFSSLDIENYFVQVRSVMDHVTEILQANLAKGGQLPDSFRKLRESLDKYSSRLPQDIVKIVETATWFDQMRNVRDTLVHEGGQSLVFCEPQSGILFQVYGKGLRGCVTHPELMFNENVVHFERYASLTTACLIVFLDDLGKVLSSIPPFELRFGPVRSYGAGFPILQRWMTELLDTLRSRTAG